MSNSVEETENQEESKKDSDTSSEARRHALDDARRVLDQELQSLNDITQKAWRVVQFNGLVATVFASLVPTQSSLTQITPISGFLLGGAVISLGYSTYRAFQTQQRESISTGPETDMFRAVAKHDYDEVDYLSRAINIHSDCFDKVQSKTEDKSEDVDNALITSILGVILLVAGTILLFIL